MRFLHKYLLLLLACLLPLEARAQTGGDAGAAGNLSHLGVRAFAQDSLGNMWIATLAGYKR